MSDTNERALAEALRPMYSAWHGARGASVRDLEKAMWQKVAEGKLLIMTDEVLVGRWVMETLGIGVCELLQ